MKLTGGKRLLVLIGGLGALIAGVVVWFSDDANVTLTGVCVGIGLILLAWVQFGEEFRKR